MEDFTLPDGRQPLRFGTGNSAYYIKARGDGEVRYTFAMIRYIQKHRRRISDEERSRIAKQRAEKYIQKDPEWFNKLGKKGGSITKDDRKNSSHQEG